MHPGVNAAGILAPGVFGNGSTGKMPRGGGGKRSWAVSTRSELLPPLAAREVCSKLSDNSRGHHLTEVPILLRMRMQAGHA